jgi:hypothetical protein
MDPFITPIALILGKYAIDKGAKLVEEVGPKALETAKEMFALALDRLRKDPKGEVIAGEFEKDPETYQKPVEKALDETARADPEFAAQLKELLAKFEEAAKAHAAATGTTYQVTHTGSGGLAVGPGAIAAGERGVVAGRDMRGTVITGDGNVVSSGSSQVGGEEENE